MRVFIAVLVLIFSLQSWTKADDIRDLQIEGMSIGDSLLDYLNESQIKVEKQLNKKIKFWRTNIRKNLKTYDAVQVWWNKKDRNFQITHIGGILFFDNDINNCIKKQKEISADIIKSYPNLKFDEKKDIYNKDETTYHYTLEFPNEDLITIQCYEFSDSFKKKHNYIENLKVMIVPKEVNDHYLEVTQ